MHIGLLATPLAGIIFANSVDDKLNRVWFGVGRGASFRRIGENFAWINIHLTQHID